MQTETKPKENRPGFTEADLRAAESRGRAQGARDAYADVAQTCEALGFGLVDVETGEDASINGADAVEAIGELYGRATQAIGGEAYALQHPELLAGDAQPAAPVIPVSLRTAWAPERNQDLPKAEAGRCLTIAEALASLATSGERGGDVDLLERVTLLDDIIEQARQECQSRPKAEAMNVLRILAAMKTETELGAGEVDLAYRSAFLDELVASARSALGLPGTSSNASQSKPADRAQTSE